MLRHTDPRPSFDLMKLPNPSSEFQPFTLAPSSLHSVTRFNPGFAASLGVSSDFGSAARPFDPSEEIHLDLLI